MQARVYRTEPLRFTATPGSAPLLARGSPIEDSVPELSVPICVLHSGPKGVVLLVQAKIVIATSIPAAAGLPVPPLSLLL